MISKLDSNRRNALQSSGPKTAEGKRNSSRNALKHGFFTKELILSDAENMELDRLRHALHKQHHPRTALQYGGLEAIVYCHGRCKMAARLESRRVGILLKSSEDRELEPKETEDLARMRWYAASRQDLRGARRFLDGIRQEFEQLGLIPEKRKEELDKIFGIGFYESSTKWQSIHKDTILAAHHMEEMAKIFPEDHPSGDNQPTKVVVDPSQSLQMVSKLIEEKLQHLHDLNRSWEQRGSEAVGAANASPVDFAPRYFTTASRDLHRAVEWFVYLRKNKL
jgi:hypothetical protein